MRPTIPPPNLRLSPTCAECAYVGEDGTEVLNVHCLRHGQEVFYASICDDYEEPKAFAYLGYQPGVGDVYGTGRAPEREEEA